MAKKKVQNHNPPKAKEFHIAPFAALKGVAVTEQTAPAQIKPLIKEPSNLEEESLDLFLQAVAGVRPMQANNKKQIKSIVNPESQSVKKTENTLNIIDETAFLEEIGRLKIDTKFTDDIPNEDELQPLAGNRLRQVKRGIVSVSHQIDLHGLTREEAIDELKRFLKSAQIKGQKAVLVITGKGNHSAEEPVLHQAVASWLREAGRTLVIEFSPAPKEMGGSGAYVVFLRQSISVP